ATIQMPTVSSTLTRTDYEGRLIERGIRQGAEYKPHWAFVAPEKMEVPEVDDDTWPTNEIDYFVQAQMERKGLKPNPEADKARLLRRVKLELGGLARSGEQLAAFLAYGAPCG